MKKKDKKKKKKSAAPKNFYIIKNGPYEMYATSENEVRALATSGDTIHVYELVCTQQAKMVIE